MTLRVLVVDDEPPARRKLVRMASAHPNVTVTEAVDGPTAVQILEASEIDLVFLDIQMPGMDGFEVIDAVGADAMPYVVFVTAYDAHALRAFEVAAVDYVLKPYPKSRFDAAFERAKARLTPASISERTPPTEIPPVHPLMRFVVNERGRVRFVPLDTVLYLKSSGNYVEVFTSDASHLVRSTLTRTETRLDSTRFTRVHRTVIVRIDAIAEMQPVSHGDYDLVLTNGTALRASRRYVSRLLDG